MQRATEYALKPFFSLSRMIGGNIRMPLIAKFTAGPSGWS